VSLGYDAKSRILEIEFHGTGIYRYFDVPPQIFGILLNAPSKGHYFDAEIRNSFVFQKVS